MKFKPGEVVRVSYRNGFYKVVGVRSDNYLYLIKIMKDSGSIILPQKTSKFMIRDSRCSKVTEVEIEKNKKSDILKWDNLKALLTKSVESLVNEKSTSSLINLEEISAPNIAPCNKPN